MHIQICNQKGPIKKTISNQHMKISLSKIRDAMARDKIQKMTVDKVIQRLPRGLQQGGTR
jgi:hypothetical protein